MKFKNLAIMLLIEQKECTIDRFHFIDQVVKGKPLENIAFNLASLMEYEFNQARKHPYSKFYQWLNDDLYEYHCTCDYSLILRTMTDKALSDG